MKTLISFFCLCLLGSYSIAQTSQFASFSGKVYILPDKELEKGHGPHIYDNEVIGEVDFAELNFTKQSDEEGLPGVIPLTKFGLVLFSTLTISKKGCYSFMLASDDGSKLWIDEQLVVNNDRPHRMLIKVDSLGLEQGEYPVKLWYYNAYPTQLGLVLKSKFISDNLKCSDKKIEQIVTLIQSDVLFDFDSSTLNKNGYVVLDSLSNRIEKSNLKKITVVGHTDNTGRSTYNEKLSLRRADEVRRYIESRIGEHSLTFEIQGLGESNPAYNNSTPANRAKNRRVEIIME